MATDLMQLRWQHIRTFEKNLELQEENTKLRKRLVSGENSKKLELKTKNMEVIVKKATSWLRSALIDLRSSCKRDIMVLFEDTKSRILDLVTVFSDAEMKRETALLLYRTKCENLEKRMEQSRHQLESSLQSSSQESVKLEVKLTRLRGDMEAVVLQKEALAKELEATRTLVSQQSDRADTAQRQLKESQEECRLLRTRLRTASEAEQRSAAELRALAQEHEDALVRADASIDALREENEQLREALLEVEAQLSKLAGAHADNNNFAKFVALKQQNMELNKKVQELTQPREKPRDKDRERGRKNSLAARDKDGNKEREQARRGSNAGGQTQTHTHTQQHPTTGAAPSSAPVVLDPATASSAMRSLGPVPGPRVRDEFEDSMDSAEQGQGPDVARSEHAAPGQSRDGLVDRTRVHAVGAGAGQAVVRSRDDGVGGLQPEVPLLGKATRNSLAQRKKLEI